MVKIVWNRIFLMLLSLGAILAAREGGMYYTAPRSALVTVNEQGRAWPFSDVNGRGLIRPLRQGQALHVEWQTRNNETRHHLEWNWQTDVPMPAVRVLPDGALAALDVGGRLRVYDANGHLIRTRQLYPSHAYNSENICLLDVSENGRLLTVIWLAHTRETLLTLWSPAGEPITRQKYTDQYLRQARLSPDGAYYGVALYNTAPFRFNSAVYNADGTRIIQHPRRVRDFIFDSPRQQVALQDTKSLTLFALITGVQEGVYASATLINAVAPDNNGGWWLQAGNARRSARPGYPAWVYKGLSLCRIDRKGRELSRQALSGSTYYPSLISQKNKVWIGLEEGQVVREAR
ncbi:MAG: hypothetical protein D6677_02175 [Calditrichaeota bacterium]|nr:MAG: hypothetical protein D6677_02175 [Calditrichota bacterium]